MDRGSVISHCIEDWLGKRLWTSRKTDHGMVMMMMMMMTISFIVIILRTRGWKKSRC